jgi:hypothetical protein
MENSPRSDQAERDRIERSFFKDGRLTELPAQRKKRIVVLERLVQAFELERDYTELEVNGVLKQFHPDVATLRREFIDVKMMTRAAGVYRRVSGYQSPPL